MKLSILSFCISWLPITYCSGQFDSPAKDTLPISFYINLRDLLDPTAALSFGIHYPVSATKILDSQVGFINPFTSLFSPYATINIRNKEHSDLSLNNYGLKMSNELKFVFRNTYNKKLFHGPQLIYQYEISQGELEYERHNSYRQYIDTKWQFHTVGLYYKIGNILYKEPKNYFIELAFGFGAEYIKDINSVLSEFKDARFRNSEFSFSAEHPKPGTFFPEPATFIQFGNTDAVIPNLIFSCKLGFPSRSANK